ncbi:hypothetical protein PGB90_006958 [Kerria lacca]
MVSDNSNGLILAKLCSMFVLPVASIIAGLLPIKLIAFSIKNNPQKQMLLDRSMSFALHVGAGILLCTIFLHLLPDLRNSVLKLQITNVLPPSSLSYSELIMCIGFFMMYSIEQFVHSCLLSRSMNTKTKLKCDENKTDKSVFTLENDTSLPAVERSCSTKVLNCLEYKHIKDRSCEHKNYHSCENHHHYYAGGDHSSDNDDDNNELCDHDHVPNISKSFVSGLLTVVALSIHETFEGMTVGLQNQTEMVFYMLAAISCHKIVLAMFVGIQSVSNETSSCVRYAYIVFYSLASSAGILIGIIVSMNSANNIFITLCALILQGLATGTLLYVVFFEIYMKNIGVFKLQPFLKTVASISGFVFMTFVQTRLSPENCKL